MVVILTAHHTPHEQALPCPPGARVAAWKWARKDMQLSSSEAAMWKDRGCRATTVDLPEVKGAAGRPPLPSSVATWWFLEKFLGLEALEATPVSSSRQAVEMEPLTANGKEPRVYDRLLYCFCFLVNVD